jgi:glycosyltransferase involved in cell wall biosynthesis
VRILFALPGLHAVWRGAEISFINIASGLVRRGHEVTLIGSGAPQPQSIYKYLEVPAIDRKRFEKFPRLPALRNDTAWEEATFVPGFLRSYAPQDYDVTLTCSYPFLNWVLRSRHHRGQRPAHVFVTQNGDWPARARNSEYRLFDCDGLVCINPRYLEANGSRFTCALIPNGVDLEHFHPAPAKRSFFGLQEEVPLVLMVSALIESKFVDRGIDAVSKLPGVHLAVAGDGPMRDVLSEKAAALMPGRYHNFTTTPDRMPALYSSADAFLHLSRDESFGNVFVEAMACGITTVAWDLPNTRWITGSTGRLVADGDQAALVSTIGSALRQGDGQAELNLRAQHFSWERIAQEYETFLSRVVALGRG